MTRRKTGKKSIFQFFFFRTFLRWCSKNYTQDTTTLDSRNSRRRESKSCPRLISRGGVSPRGVVLFNVFFFFFRCEELRNSFFCLRPDRWSLVWRRVFQMAKREGSRIFHQNFECFRRSSCIGGEGGAAFFYFPSLCRGCSMCVCSLAHARIAYLYENRITIRIII